MRGKRWVVGGVVTALVVTLAVVLVPRTGWWYCRYGEGLVRPDPMTYHAAEDLDLPSEFTEVVDGLEAAGLGSLAGGVTTPGTTAMLDGDQVLFATSSQAPRGERGGYSGILSVLTPQSGDSWAVRLSGSETGVGFSGEHLLTRGIPEDRSPLVVAYDRATGDLRSCAWPGDDAAEGPLAAAELPSGDVLLAHPPTDTAAGHDLTRIDLSTADERWRGHSELVDLRRMDAVGDVAVASRFRPLDVSSDGAAPSYFLEEDQVLSLEAHDLDSGELRWSWPDEPVAAPQLAAVLGTVPPDDTVDDPGDGSGDDPGDNSGDGILLASVVEVPEGGGDAARRVVGLDAATGAELWSHDTAAGVQGAVFGDLLIYHGGPHRAATEARDGRTGELRWSLPPGEASDGAGPDVRTAVPLGEQLLLLDDTRDLWTLETETGETEELELPDHVVQSVLTSEELVVVRLAATESATDGAVLVFDRT